MEKITSLQNPRIKLIRKLRDKRDREREGRFVIDDTRDLRRALAQGYRVDFALYCPALPDYVPGIPADQVYEVPLDLMTKISYRENPSAFVAVMHTPSSALPPMARFPVLGLVNLQKPGNIGALLRTADAARFKTILLIDTALDLYNPNIIRSSTGACFLGNVYSLTTAAALDWLRENGCMIIAAHLDGDRSLYDVTFDEQSAVILGTEDVGLDETWVEACDMLMKIPMRGELADSLNVSVSGAVIMYEVLRQRLAAGFD